MFLYKFSVLNLLLIFLLNVNAYANQKFSLNGEILSYDTERNTNEKIDRGDEDYLKEILKANNVKVIKLNSGGGFVYPSERIAEIIIDYELDTHVDGICYSACYTIFLAGKKRSLQRLSKIGIHQSYWDSGSMRNFYHKYKDDPELNFTDPFDFAEWAVEDIQNDIHKEFKYQNERGVSGNFIIKTLRAGRNDMWVPTRKELISSGVINEKINDFNDRNLK